MLDIKYLKKQTIFYLIISGGCILFSHIYHMFSYGIYSKFMMSAYLIPLIFGFVLSLLLYLFRVQKIKRVTINLYNASLATWTVYLIFRGILEIYGTSNDLINLYLYIGIILNILSVVSLLFFNKKTKNI